MLDEGRKPVVFVSSSSLGTGQAPSSDSPHGHRVAPTNGFVEFSREEIEQSIPDRFEKIVRTYPDRIAVKIKDHALTYAQLNTMANRVSYAIVAQRGVEPEPVGLLFENGIPLIVSMLGVLKAGKFFVPLDPLSPKLRIIDTLADTQAALILIDQQTSSLAQQVATRKNQLIEIDAINPDTPAGDRRVPIPSHALACIVYTSGSTGQAKGVMLNHRYLLHRTMLVAATDGACENDKYAHLSAGTANAINNTFTALLLGATLLPFDVKQEGIARLAHWLIEEKISICFISSPLYRELCAMLTGSERFPNLRYVRLRSDVVYKSDIDLHKKYFPPTCALATGLASSEAGPLRRYRIDHETEIDGSEVPVGYALEDKEILLLDDDGREIRFNQVGEIVVRSKYLSVGYWNRPDLTEAKFKPDPHDPEKWLYYTGDLGLMLPDGCLIHKGRKDFRVKIRGYGVELAEVEKSLRSHRDIREAIVVALKTESGEARLAAYFTSRAQPAPSVSELRGYLKEKLPDYMMPSAFVELDAIPLTSNGKLDRSALPAPDHNRPNLAGPYARPEDNIQEAVVRIWQEILNVRPIGIDDNFFELGGHSLLAAKLFARLDDEFGRLLPLGVLLAAPTVRLLAERYRSSVEPEKMSPLVALTTTGSLPPVYAVPGVFGNVIGLVDLCRELGPRQPFYGFQSVGLDGAEPPLDSVEEMAQLYLREIRGLQPRGPYAFLGVCFGARVAYEMARLLLDAGDEVAFLGLLDPIGLEKDETGEGSPSPRTLFPRARAVGAFVTERVQLYAAEMRELDRGNRLRFIIKKIRAVGHRFGDSKAMRTVRREMHQLAVYKASKRAGERYHPGPIHGRLRAVEIFDTARSRNNPTRKYIDWNALWNGQIRRHLMPGTDSGDMVSGENARVLARLLTERMRAAFGSPSGKEA